MALKKLDFQIDLSNLDYFIIWAMTCLIAQTSLSFNIFPFLLPFSLLVWGLCCLNFIILVFLRFRRLEITSYEGLVMLFFLILISFTLLKGTDLKHAIYYFIEIMIMLLSLEYFRGHYATLLKGIALGFSLCVYLNAIVMIILPDWMFAADDEFNIFLLGGNYNQMGCRMLCALIANILCVPYSKKWLVNVVIIAIISLVSLIVVGSMTSLSCIILFLVSSLFFPRWVLKLEIVSFFIFYVLFQSFVCFSGEGLHNNELASYIIEDVLGKDMTFTKRTEKWDAAGKLFMQSPIIGYGEVDLDWYVANMTSEAKGPHNFIYSILIRGGLVLMSLFIYLGGVSYWRIMPFERRDALLLVLGTVTLLFMMCFEMYPMFFIFYLLFMMYYYPEIYAESEGDIQRKEVAYEL